MSFLLCLTYFIYNNVSKVQSKVQYMIACIRTSFILWLNSILLYMYTTYCLPINLSMDTGYFYFLLQWILVYKYQSSYFQFLGYIPEVELLVHMGTVSLTFWGTDMVFTTVAVPYYTPSSNVQGLYILVNTCYFSFF